jgi:polar amino acid transport system permease protein
MSTTTAVSPEAHAEVEEYRPHKKWFQRPDVMVPVVFLVLVYAVLVGLVEQQNFFSTRMEPDGNVQWDWMYFFHLVPLIFEGLLVLIKGTLLGFAVAVVLGFVFALGRRSTRKWLSWPTALVIEFIRSTPLLVQLFFLLALVRASAALELSPITILMIGLGLHYAAYCSEAYRAGINSVDKGQWEAATALNLGPVTKWFRVIMPQAVPNVLPALGNYLVAAFKDAPMAFVVNVHCLLFAANQIRSDDFRAQEPYILVGVAFLAVSLPAAWAVRKLEKRISYERV